MERQPHYIVGLDLGQAQDPTALVVTEVRQIDGEHHYDVRHIERLPLQTRYPAIVKHTCAVVQALVDREGKPQVALVVDFTGCGRPVGDLLIEAEPPCDLALVTITGADSVVSGGGGLRVPKRDLASVVQVLLQSGRLRIAAEHPMAATLTQELTGFRVKISLTGHDSYGAGEDWRSAPHDDLVLALAMACWYGEKRMLVGPLSSIPSGDDDDW